VPFWEDPRRSLLQFFLPAFTVGYLISGVTARMVRSSMLEVLRQDYIRTARAKGLRDTTVYFRHAFKNASIPVVTIMGAQMGTLLGGALISETIFSLPGIGRLFITSVASRDYPIIQAVVLFMILAVLVVNLVVDMLYAALDPRIRYS
jgi:peptide/nickel transport system permease protein